MSLFSYTYARRTTHSGFTLIELIVVIAIMMVISASILSRYGQFNGVVLLRNLAYDIAITIRQAQVYSISGKQGGTASGAQYGVYVAAATPNQYLIFADDNGNRAYNTGEAVEIFTVRNGYSIYDFCGDKASGTPDCKLSGIVITSLTLMFKRPDPDAIITTSASNSGYTQARIIARSASGNTRAVTITLTGQISVQQGD